MDFKTYSELLYFVDNTNKAKYVLNYDFFAVVKIDNEYWYFEQGENDCSDFGKVELVAELSYNIHNDMLFAFNENLSSMFENDICGETDIDDDGNVKYLWFKEKGE